MKILATYDNHEEADVLRQIAKDWTLRSIEFSIRPSWKFLADKREKEKGGRV